MNLATPPTGIRMRHTLAGRLTGQLSLAIGLLFMAATIAITLDIRQRSITESLAMLEIGQSRLAALEDARFEKIGFVEDRATALLTQQLAQQRNDTDIAARFDQLFPAHGDGTRRSADGLFDGEMLPGTGWVQGVGAFIGGEAALTTADKRLLLAAFDTVRLLGEGLRPELKSLYFFTPQNQLIMFAPDRPDRLAYYRRQAPADFDFQQEEFSRNMTPARNPERKLMCTSLQPIMFDTSRRTWTTGCMTPIDRDGHHVGSWGISLLLDEVIGNRAPGRTPTLSGGRKAILVSREGKLIFHPDYTRQSDPRTQAFLDLRQTDDPKLQALWRFLQNHRDGAHFVGWAPELNGYAALGTVATPGWYALSVQSGAAVDSAAFQAARWVILVGVSCLLLQALMLVVLLRRNVGLPIAGLTARARKIAGINDAGEIVPPEPMETDRSELEQLHASFDAMEDRIVRDRRRLKRSFDLFAANVGNIALFMLDTNGRIINWNRGAECITGYDSVDIIGRSYDLFFEPEDRIKSVPQAVLAAAAKGQTSDDRVMERRDGRQFRAASQIEPIRGEAAALMGFAVVLRDVTEERQREGQVQESMRLLQLAEDTAELGHWRLDLASHELRWSDWTCRIHGVPIGSHPRYEDAIGYYDADRRRDVQATLDAARDSGKDFTFRSQIIRTDGVTRHVEVKGQVENGDDGSAVAMFGVIRDITDQIIAETELIRSRNEADAAAAARTDFLAIMSHEIRTPMSGIIGMLDVLDTAITPEARSAAIASIQRSSQTLMQVLDDVLDHSTIETGNLVLEAVDFDLAELVEQTGDLFRATAAAKGVSLLCHSQGPIWVKGDPSRVQQIIANFTSNAVKFTGSGSVTLAGSRMPLGRCRIEVRDTGVGIDPDVLPRLFTAYTQADSSTARHFGGTGLGLAISRRLAEAMGGDVGADSEIGKGSCFWAELPLASGKPLAIAATEAQSPLVNAHGQAPHVLLVEDTAASRMAAAAQIEAMGCHVETAVNGLDALMAMAKMPFDAVVMDSSMPVLDGAAATRLARLLPGGAVPIIGLTAHSHSDQLAPLHAAGMDLVLTKPFRRAALQAALKPLVARRRVAPADTATATSLALAAIPASLRPRLADSARRDLAQLASAIDSALANGDAAGASMALHALRGVAQTLGAADLAAMTNFAEGLIDAVGTEQSRWLGDIIVDATAATLAAAGPALAASGDAA